MYLYSIYVGHQVQNIPLCTMGCPRVENLYTLYPILYTLYPIPYTLYPIPYTLYSIRYTLYSIHYTLYSIHYTLYPIPYYPIPYTLYPTTLLPYTLFSPHWDKKSPNVEILHSGTSHCTQWDILYLVSNIYNIHIL
jgi:hypothetical protein